MNKRKTLRMTSILLALMMFFGMVSVLLVPAGVAGAADPNVSIDVDFLDATGSGDTTIDTDNVLVQPSNLNDKKLNFTLKVTNYEYTGAMPNFTGLYMVLLDPSNKPVTGYTISDRVVMDTVDKKTFTKDITIEDGKAPFHDSSGAPIKGLYKIQLYPYDYAGVGDVGGTHTLGAFYYAQLVHAPTSVNTKVSTPTNKVTGNAATEVFGNKYFYDETVTTDVKHYVGPGAEIKVQSFGPAPTLSSSATCEIRFINGFTWGTVDKMLTSKFVADHTATGSAKEVKYTIPTSIKDNIKGSLYTANIDPKNSSAVCYAYPAVGNGYTAGTGDSIFTLTSDALNPKINSDEIKFEFGGRNATGIQYSSKKLSFNNYLAKDDFALFKKFSTTPAYDLFLRMYADKATSITDERLLFNLRLLAYIPGEGDPENNFLMPNLYTATAQNLSSTGSKYTIDPTKMIANIWAATGTPALSVLNKANNMKLYLRAYDEVDNYADLSTGNLKIDDVYNPIKELHAVVNEYNMVVGDTVTMEQLKAWMKTVVIGNDPTKAATFEKEWQLIARTIAGTDNNLSDYFDIVYDEDNVRIVSMTAKKAGEANIKLEPISWFYTPAVLAVDPLDESKSYENTLLGLISNRLFFKISEKADKQITEIAVTPKTKEMAIGEKFTPTATVKPADAINKVEWFSGNTAIATVNKETGEITAVADGVCFVYARSDVNSGIQDDIQITVGKTVDPDPVPEPKPDDGWKDEGNNRYYYIDGQKVVGWRKIDGSWYFFDYTSAAMRANGWLKEGGKWYYLNSNGTMKSAEWFKDNNGKWYWLKANGAMAAGWEKINGTWYYFNASGAMQTGWVNVRGIWYYMKSSGAMAEGWLQDGGSWYYLTPGGGAMVTGRVTINGRASNFATSGRWLGYV